MKDYLIWIVMCSFLLVACENTRHSIGVSGKPLSTDAEQNIKMNYKITFGKIRPKEDED